MDFIENRPDGVIKIAYPTGRIDDKEIEFTIFSAIRSILIKYPGKDPISFVRKSVPSELRGIDGVVLEKSINDYKKFIAFFYSSSFDIGVARS